MNIRVYYEDTDAGGIVYHTNYLKFCERARSELFFQNNMVPLEGDESGFVVKRIEADFKGSAKLGDIVEVKSQLLTHSRVMVKLRQSIYKEDKLLFEMAVELVFMKNGKIARIPESFMTLLSTIEVLS